MEIRAVRVEEYEWVGELTVAAYREVHDPADMDEYSVQLRDVAGRVADAEVLVAVSGGEGAEPLERAELGGRAEPAPLLGAVTYVPGPDSAAFEFDAADAASIRMLAVAPEAQRRGVGEALVRACIDRATSAGRGQILLHSTDAMTAAHRIYRRLGFERDITLDWTVTPTLTLRGFRLKL